MKDILVHHHPVLNVVKRVPLSAKTQHAMPSLTEVQNTAITLMDYFYFHDTASLSTYSVPKNEFFPHFTKTIDDVTYARGHQGKKFHLYQHFLLCYIETMAGTPQPLEVNNYLELVEAANRLLEKVASNVEKQGFALDEFRADIDTLDEIYKFATIKRELVYKLVAQYLYFEYDLTSIAVFNKFLDLEILKSDRYQAKNAEDKKERFNDIFFRAMLFIEFEVYKKQLYVKNTYKKITLEIDFNNSEEKINDMLLFVKSMKQVQLQIGNDYQSIADIDLDSKKSIEKYIKEINSRLVHNRLFLNNISQCIGLMGSWFVNYFKETNTERATHAEPLNEDDPKKKVCTVEAKERMLEHGFTLHEPRTFNDHYKDFCLYYRLVREYFRTFSEDQIGIMTPDIINYFFIIRNDDVRFGPLFKTL